jgi:hypothetical protein
MTPALFRPHQGWARRLSSSSPSAPVRFIVVVVVVVVVVVLGQLHQGRARPKELLLPRLRRHHNGRHTLDLVLTVISSSPPCLEVEATILAPRRFGTGAPIDINKLPAAPEGCWLEMPTSTKVSSGVHQDGAHGPDPSLGAYCTNRRVVPFDSTPRRPGRLPWLLASCPSPSLSTPTLSLSPPPPRRRPGDILSLPFSEQQQQQQRRFARFPINLFRSPTGGGPKARASSGNRSRKADTAATATATAAAGAAAAAAAAASAAVAATDADDNNCYACGCGSFNPAVTTSL